MLRAHLESGCWEGAAFLPGRWLEVSTAGGVVGVRHRVRVIGRDRGTRCGDEERARCGGARARGCQAADCADLSRLPARQTAVVRADRGSRLPRQARLITPRPAGPPSERCSRAAAGPSISQVSSRTVPDKDVHMISTSPPSLG